MCVSHFPEPELQAHSIRQEVLGRARRSAELAGPEGKLAGARYEGKDWHVEDADGDNGVHQALSLYGRLKPKHHTIII